tara:strand:+ start:83 stop:592 length:510 start_codon:yes stop_codon:yes gene_type:complete
MDDSSSAIDRVEAALQRIITEGGNYNILTVSSSNTFVQFLGELHGQSIYTYTHGPETADELEKTLTLLGFSKEHGGWGFHRDVNEKPLRELAEMAVVVLCDLYAAEPSAIELEISLENVDWKDHLLETIEIGFGAILLLLPFTLLAHFIGLIDLNESVIVQEILDFLGI